MTKLYCLDSHILIWGVKKEAEKGQEEMISKAVQFLKWLDNRGKALIPSIVVGELLLPVPVEKHPQVLSLIEQKFMVCPFDMASASCFAKIWQSKRDDGMIEKLKQNFGATRAELRADSQIVAVAVTRGASCIYSYDGKLAKFAEGFIEVREMPDLLHQPEFDLQS